MTYHRIALVSPDVAPADLETVATVLTAQASSFGAYWERFAMVSAFPVGQIPPGYWKIEVQANIGDPSALGFHTDDSNQPYALVEFTDGWSVTASHEFLEMLGDPWGNWMTPAVLPADSGLSPADRSVLLLKELCDPCEAFSYPIGGVQVSDFLTPNYYNSAAPPHSHCSQMGSIHQPFELAQDGYLSFLRGNEWFQWTNFAGQGSQITDLGPNSRAARNGRSIREWIDELSRAKHPKRK